MSTHRGRSVNPLQSTPPRGTADESLPALRKSPSLIKRLSFSSRSKNDNDGVTPSGSQQGKSSASSPSGGLRILSVVSPRNRRRSARSNAMMETEEIEQTPNVLNFLQKDCPHDVLPKILAFAGPQKTAVLARTNHHWNKIITKEATWRVMCEELYKVRVLLVWLSMKAFVSALVRFRFLNIRTFLFFLFFLFPFLTSGSMVIQNRHHGRSIIG